MTIIPHIDDRSLLQMPLDERVLDRLVDVLLDVEEVLAMIERNRSASLDGIEPFIRRAFEEVDQAIRKVSD